LDAISKCSMQEISFPFGASNLVAL